MAVSILQLVSLGVFGLGVILHIVGTATPAWVTVNSFSYFDSDYYLDYSAGLFKSCRNKKCLEIEETRVIRTVKALMLTGIVLSLLAGLLAAVAIVLRWRNHNLSRLASVICLVLCLLAGLLIFIGVIIFGVDFGDALKGADTDIYKIRLGYSFGLCITGSILIVVGGVMVSAVGLKKPDNNPTMGTTAAVQNPPMMYLVQAGGMMYQPQAGGMVYPVQAGGMMYQPQAGGMMYQPQAGGMVYPVQAGGIMHQPQAGGMVYQPQSGEDMYQNQVGAMAYQPQPGGIVSQNQEGGMVHSSATTKENDDTK